MARVDADLGRQMRRTREFLGLTQQELAQRAGVSQGRRQPL
jgi:predicted transcriptional regulator